MEQEAGKTLLIIFIQIQNLSRKKKKQQQSLYLIDEKM